MEAGQNVSVQRKRDRCPFCHDEIVAGEVWICPGCGASQHAACREEQQGCAACEWTAVAESPKGASLHPELASRREELERLGFQVLHADPDRLTATLGRWYWDCMMTKLTHTVFVRRVPVLSEETYLADLVKLQEESQNLDSSKLPRGFQKGNAVFVLYLADQVEPEVVERIETKPERGWAKFHFPIALDLSTGRSAYLKTTPTWGAIYYAKFRYLAERLLHPEAPVAKEPLSWFGVGFMVCMVVLFMAMVLLASLP